jgi:hypothetical protein
MVVDGAGQPMILVGTRRNWRGRAADAQRGRGPDDGEQAQRGEQADERPRRIEFSISRSQTGNDTTK